MSIECMTRVWREARQKGSSLLLLLAIADNAHDDGFAWPGLPYLAQKTRMSRRHVIRMINKIEEDGELYVNRRMDDDTKRRGEVNQYIVLVGLTAEEIGLVFSDRMTEMELQAEEVEKILDDLLIKVDKLSGVTTCQGGVTTCHGGGDT